jgi:hypothetical protein
MGKDDWWFPRTTTLKEKSSGSYMTTGAPDIREEMKQ